MAKRGGLNKQYELSEDMADFMGKNTASRMEITKKIWAHIKKNGLQDEDNRRDIVPDDTLEPILGSKKISMFDIATKISEHVFND